MRRAAIYLIIYVCAGLCTSARELVFRGESLATALAALREIKSDYTINFIANDLDQLPVHADLKGLSVPQAVKRLCAGLPVKAKIKDKEIFIQYDTSYKPRTIKLTGAVLDARSRDYLMDAKVELLSEDSTLIDSIRARERHYYYGESGRQTDYEVPRYTFEVPALPATTSSAFRWTTTGPSASPTSLTVWDAAKRRATSRPSICTSPRRPSRR